MLIAALILMSAACAFLLAVSVSCLVALSAQEKRMQARQDALLDRLQSRSLAEFSMYAPSAGPRPPEPEQHFIADETGLMVWEDDDRG